MIQPDHVPFIFTLRHCFRKSLFFSSRVSSSHGHDFFFFLFFLLWHPRPIAAEEQITPLSPKKRHPHGHCLHMMLYCDIDRHLSLSLLLFPRYGYEWGTKTRGPMMGAADIAFGCAERKPTTCHQPHTHPAQAAGIAAPGERDNKRHKKANLPMQISPEIGSVSSAAHSIVAGAAVGFLVQQIGSRTGPGPPPLFFGEERGIKKKEKKKKKIKQKPGLSACLFNRVSRLRSPERSPSLRLLACRRSTWGGACVRALPHMQVKAVIKKLPFFPIPATLSILEYRSADSSSCRLTTLSQPAVDASQRLAGT